MMDESKKPSNPFGIVPLSNFVPWGFGFVHHSIAILYHQVPNPNLTIRNFCIAVQGLGFETDRLKTGTPARVDRRSIDFSVLEAQVRLDSGYRGGKARQGQDAYRFTVYKRTLPHTRPK
jgi:hypothetical protein